MNDPPGPENGEALGQPAPRQDDPGNLETGPVEDAHESENEPVRDRGEELLSEERVPLSHYATHLPKHPNCKACQTAKMQNRQCRRAPEDKTVTHNISATLWPPIT